MSFVSQIINLIPLASILLVHKCKNTEMECDVVVLLLHNEFFTDVYTRFFDYTFGELYIWKNQNKTKMKRNYMRSTILFDPKNFSKKFINKFICMCVHSCPYLYYTYLSNSIVYIQRRFIINNTS